MAEKYLKCPNCGTEIDESVLTTRIAEYGFLERRMQNDSRISYGLIGALMVASLALVSASSDYYNSAPEGGRTGAFALAVGMIPGIGGFLLLYLAFRVQSRFNDTSNIRRARAIQIEEDLDFASFTLFKPWIRLDDRYYDVLGRLAKDSWWNRLPHVRFDNRRKGFEEYERINKESRISRYSKAILLVLWAIGALALFVRILA